MRESRMVYPIKPPMSQKGTPIPRERITAPGCGTDPSHSRLPAGPPQISLAPCSLEPLHYLPAIVASPESSEGPPGGDPERRPWRSLRRLERVCRHRSEDFVGE
ncbi:hypothetical protein NDU88_005567 [Pleurodeles waltl]|uniref:Uncharacterized protein n=1 Tax=Pleurodeles waltl TaxID=8319 RepID=A0AAV7SM54_PLEWA|nr:hypothetical protein NDU88_005567 [Pleurodeles waltl]